MGRMLPPTRQSTTDGNVAAQRASDAEGVTSFHPQQKWPGNEYSRRWLSSADERFSQPK